MRRVFVLSFVLRLACLWAGGRCGENGTIDLAAALELAKKNSYELRQSLFDLGTDEARYRMAYRLFLPSLSLSYAQSGSVLYDSPDTRTKKISAALSQLVCDRGKRSHSLRLKEIDLRLKRRLLVFREEDLLLAVVNAYIEALALEAKAGILAEALALSREQERIAAEEMKLGELKELDYLDIQSRAKDLELELAEAGRSEARALHDFGRLLGLGRGGTLRPEGAVDEDYAGSVRTADAAGYLDLARKNSTDLEKLNRDLYDLRETLRREERSWMPELTAKLEVFVFGTSFPLSQPGFSIGLDFAFDTPVLPLSAGLSAGKAGPAERSLGTQGTGRVAENLEGLLSEDIARANLAKAFSGYEDAAKDLEFSVLEDLSGVEHGRRTLALLKEKRLIMEKKKRVEEVKLEAGLITRLDYVETEIELARTRIAILGGVAGLFGKETALLRRCGIAAFGTCPLPIVGRPEGGGS